MTKESTVNDEPVRAIAVIKDHLVDVLDIDDDTATDVAIEIAADLDAQGLLDMHAYADHP